VVFSVKNVAIFAQKWLKAANFCVILTQTDVFLPDREAFLGEI